MTRFAILLVSSLFLTELAVTAQPASQPANAAASPAGPGAPAQEGATIRLTTRQVLLDLVVRENTSGWSPISNRAT